MQALENAVTNFIYSNNFNPIAKAIQNEPDVILLNLWLFETLDSLRFCDQTYINRFLQQATKCIQQKRN